MFIHGYDGDLDSWAGTVQPFLDAGFHVLDFYSDPGVQTLVWHPDGNGIVYASSAIVGPAIERALSSSGFPKDQPIDVIAHSTGGLVARTLVEKAGTTIDEIGMVTVPAKWSAQIKTVALLATPNAGSEWSSECVDNPTWGVVCEQIYPGSPYLDWMGQSAGDFASRYVTVVGNADAIVTADSARLTGVSLTVLDRVCHSNAMGWGIFCDYPVVRAPGTFEVLDELLAWRT